MEHSLVDLRSKVENLTASVLAVTAKEALFRKIIDIEHEQIENELVAIQQLIEAHGLEGNTVTLGKLAAQLGLEIEAPNQIRAMYFGSAVGLDHRAWLIKYRTTGALTLPFTSWPLNQSKPRLGDKIIMSFKDGALLARVSANN